MSIASDLTTLCADQTTLVDDILAQSVLANIPASSMSTLGSFASDGTQKTVQLSGGGDAVLQVPVQDGLSFRVKVTGHTHNPTNGATLRVRLYANGTDIGLNVSQGGNSTTPDSPFHFEARVFWDSTSNVIVVDADGISYSSGSPTKNSVTYSNGLSSPSNLPFKINGSVDSTDASATLTVTELIAYAD